MNLIARMIHAFLDNIRYITIELNGSGVTGCESSDRWSTRCRGKVSSRRAIGASGGLGAKRRGTWTLL